MPKSHGGIHGRYAAAKLLELKQLPTTKVEGQKCSFREQKSAKSRYFLTDCGKRSRPKSDR
jgi:hypothetical protein